jgi:fucose permease
MGLVILRYGLNFSQASWVTAIQSVGAIAATGFGAVLGDKTGKLGIINVSFFIYALAFILMGAAGSYPVLLCALLLLGAGTKTLDMMLNAHLSDLHGESRGKYLSFLHVAFGLGAVAGPVGINWALSSGVTWQHALRAMAALYLLILACSEGYRKLRPLPSGTHRAALPDENGGRGGWEILKDPDIWRICFVILCFAGFQYGICTWLPLYVSEDLGAGQAAGNWTLSLFWAGITIGRMTFPFLLKRFSMVALVEKASLAAGIVVTAGMLGGIGRVLMLCVFLSGILTGAVFPFMVAVACEAYPERSALASSLLFLTGIVAMLIFPLLVGALSDRIGFGAALTFNCAVLLPPPLGSRRISGRRK